MTNKERQHLVRIVIRKKGDIEVTVGGVAVILLWWLMLMLLIAATGGNPRELLEVAPSPLACLASEQLPIGNGGTISVDITRYMALSGTDILYVRGEIDNHRTNYLLAKVELPLPAFTASTAHSIFFSYGRGSQPPFTSDTNALKLGYRIQWDGWFDRWR